MILLFILLTLSIIFVGFGHVVEIYVAPEPIGRNDQPGYQFRLPTTFAAGLAIAKNIRSDSKKSITEVKMKLRGGKYFLKAPCFLNGMQSYRYQSLPTLSIIGPDYGAPAIVDGGVKITGWKQSSPETPWLFRASVPKELGGLPIHQLWINDSRRIPARSPTMQFKHISKFQLVTNAGQLLPKYSQNKDLRVIVYEHWTASFHNVTEVFHTNNTISVDNPFTNRWEGDGPSGNRYYIENAPEYLSKGSGTFFHYQNLGYVSYAPSLSELELGDAWKSEVYASHLKELVVGQNTSDITLQNLTFQHARVDFTNCYQSECSGQSASFLETAALRWVNTNNILLNDIKIKHTGGYGLWFGAGVHDTIAKNMHIHDVGAGAVRIGHAIGGVDPDPKLVALNVTITDSVLEDGGHVYREGCGVLMQVAASCVVTHNDINTFRYTGISVGWTWNYVPTSNNNNIISYNHIHTIGMGDLSDMGCVYHLGADQGTHIINNICHNVSSYKKGYGGWGYYTDQASRGVVIENNIAYNTTCSAFHQHYGMDNIIRNNVFADVNTGNCDAAVRSSAHDNGDEGDRSSFTFVNNIVYWKTGPLFMATTKNSFANETFDNNVYWKIDSDPSDITFPCPPNNPFIDLSYLPSGYYLESPQYIKSNSRTSFSQMQNDGDFCISSGYGPNDPAKSKVWCTNTTQNASNTYHAMMQGDGNFCVTAYSGSDSADVLYCSMVHPGKGKYFAMIGDDHSFCVHKGTDPKHDQGTIWCAGQNEKIEIQNSYIYQKLSTIDIKNFPTTCNLTTWQKIMGQDNQSVLKDPLFKNPKSYDFSHLQPNSPALKIGFHPIDTSTVGPRTLL